MTEETDGRAAILRAAGHVEAAELLERLDDAINAKRAADEADPPPAAPEQQFTAAEAQRQAEGRVLLEAAKRDMPDLFREDR